MAGQHHVWSERLMRLMSARRWSELIGIEPTERSLGNQSTSTQVVLHLALASGLAEPQQCGSGIPPLLPNERLLYYDSVLILGKPVGVLVATAPMDEGHRVRVGCADAWRIGSGWLRVGPRRYDGQPCEASLVFEPVDLPAGLTDLKVLYTDASSKVLQDSH